VGIFKNLLELWSGPRSNSSPIDTSQGREQKVITVKEAAREQLISILMERGRNYYIRLSARPDEVVKIHYELRPDRQAIQATDLIDSSNGFLLVVESSSQGLLEDAVLDHMTLPSGRGGFLFANPNAQ
jgi:Fe-S cluster assembly iron-binding protein IscA